MKGWRLTFEQPRTLNSADNTCAKREGRHDALHLFCNEPFSNCLEGLALPLQLLAILGIAIEFAQQLLHRTQMALRKRRTHIDLHPAARHHLGIATPSPNHEPPCTAVVPAARLLVMSSQLAMIPPTSSRCGCGPLACMTVNGVLGSTIRRPPLCDYNGRTTIPVPS